MVYEHARPRLRQDDVPWRGNESAPANLYAEGPTANPFVVAEIARIEAAAREALARWGEDGDELVVAVCEFVGRRGDGSPSCAADVAVLREYPEGPAHERTSFAAFDPESEDWHVGRRIAEMAEAFALHGFRRRGGWRPAAPDARDRTDAA